MASHLTLTEAQGGRVLKETAPKFNDLKWQSSFVLIADP